MPALDIHHSKTNEPTFEHVYVNVLDGDHRRSTCLTPSFHSNLMVDTFIANADPAECAPFSPPIRPPTHFLSPHQAQRHRPQPASLITTQRLCPAGHHRSQPFETQAVRVRINRDSILATFPHFQRRLVTTC